MYRQGVLSGTPAVVSVPPCRFVTWFADTIDCVTRIGLVDFPDVPPGDDVVLSATTFVAYETALSRPLAVCAAYMDRSRVSPLWVGSPIACLPVTSPLGPIDADGLNAACREEIGSGMKHEAARSRTPAKSTQRRHRGGRRAAASASKAVGDDGCVGAEVT